MNYIRVGGHIYRRAYITNEIAMVKHYLTMSDADKGKALVDYDPQEFAEFLEESGEDVPDDVRAELESAELDTAYEYLGELPDDLYADFSEHMQHRGGHNPYAPSFLFMDYHGLVKNQWLIHFTDAAEDIASSGFTIGMQDFSNLGLTVFIKDTAKLGGYNFAFTLDSYKQYDYKKYGSEAVLFRASGIEIYHNGDEEYQVIFFGNTANTIIPITAGDDADYSVHGCKDGHVLYENDDIDEVIGWVVDNFAQYRKQLVCGS